jgi:hypothetical protein
VTRVQANTEPSPDVTLLHTAFWLVCVSHQVTALKVEVTQLQVVPGRGAVAVGTGVHETYPVQLVLKSIGYKSLPLEGVAFDPSAGIIPNLAGRVLQGGGPACRTIALVSAWVAARGKGMRLEVLTCLLNACCTAVPVTAASCEGQCGMCGSFVLALWVPFCTVAAAELGPVVSAAEE